MATLPKAVAPKSLLITLRLNLKTIECGVPVDTMSDFVSKSGVPLKDIYGIVIPARTLKHRRARKQLLTSDESDKLARLVRIFDQTVFVFGDMERARLWLNKPVYSFENRTPLEMLRTEAGSRLVEERLGQIDEGMFV
jgi:putative toxin-antitoxin system antitoxin component (TIGR02293 family)